MGKDGAYGTLHCLSSGNGCAGVLTILQRDEEESLGRKNVPVRR